MVIRNGLFGPYQLDAEYQSVKQERRVEPLDCRSSWISDHSCHLRIERLDQFGQGDAVTHDGLVVQ